MGGRWAADSYGGVLTGGGSTVASDQYPSALLADGVDTATSVRTSITCTAHATPHTVGAWVEVDASLSADASAIGMVLNPSISGTATDTSTLLDIGIGAGGAEVVWATISVGYSGGTNATAMFTVPGAIPAGSRVAVRCQGAVTLQAVTGIYWFRRVKADAPLAAPVTYGVNTATSGGTVVTAPGALNTKGAWTEMVASTASDLSALSLYVQGATGTTMNSSGVLIDIGIGAAAAETVIIPDVYLAGNGAEFYNPRSPMSYGVDIPAGSRIAARYARANASNTLDLVLVGTPAA